MAALNGVYCLFVSSAFFTSRELLFWRELDLVEKENRFSAPVYTTVVSAACTGPFVAAITGGFKEQRLPVAIIAAVGISTGFHLSYIVAHATAVQAGKLYQGFDKLATMPTLVPNNKVVWDPSPEARAKERKPLMTSTTEHKWWHKLVPARVLTEDEKNQLLSFQLQSLESREKVDDLTFKLEERKSLRKLYEEELKRVRAEQNTAGLELLTPK